ncbi:hypothetical protein SRHO_G00293790 [Serrasalmus rhombeus]
MCHNKPHFQRRTGGGPFLPASQVAERRDQYAPPGLVYNPRQHDSALFAPRQLSCCSSRTMTIRPSPAEGVDVASNFAGFSDKLKARFLPLHHPLSSPALLPSFSAVLELRTCSIARG